MIEPWMWVVGALVVLWAAREFFYGGMPTGHSAVGTPPPNPAYEPPADRPGGTHTGAGG